MTSTAVAKDDFLRYYESLSPEGKERYICSLDPFYFLTTYVKTHDPYHGIRDYPDFPYIEETVNALHDHRLTAFQKGRQLTFSWTFAAYGLWGSQFQFGYTGLYTSKRQEDSYELKDRAFHMWENLPDFLQQKITEDNRSTMGFKGNLAKLKFLPATDNVGRTFTAGHVFMDEFAHVTCDASKMYTSIKPTINQGGRCTVFSSPNGPFGKFWELCGGDDCPNEGWGIELDNGFWYYFMPYDVHPEHGPEWEAEAFKGMTKDEIDQEYRALWVKRGGRVYPLFDKKRHVVKPFDIPTTWPKCRIIDFGGANPTAVMWMAFNPKNGQAVIYRDYKKAGIPIREHADTVKTFSRGEGFVLGTISDHDSQSRIEWDECGIRTRGAIKDWDSGFNEVTRHLMVNDEDVPGLVIFDTCKDTIAEMMVYSWPEVDKAKSDVPERPLKVNDHLMDCLRYGLRTTKGSRTGFRPVRDMSEMDRFRKIENGLLRPGPLHRMNRILVPQIGLTVGKLHRQAQDHRIRRLHI